MKKYLKPFLSKKTIQKVSAFALVVGGGLLMTSAAYAGLQEQMSGVQSLITDRLAPIILIVFALSAGVWAGKKEGVKAGLEVGAVVILVGFIIAYIESGDYKEALKNLTSSEGSSSS